MAAGSAARAETPLLSPQTQPFSLRAEEKSLFPGQASGTRPVRPLPAPPGTAAAEGSAGTELGGPLPTPGPAPIEAPGALPTARNRGQRTPRGQQGRSPLGGGFRARMGLSPPDKGAFCDSYVPRHPRPWRSSKRSRHTSRARAPGTEHPGTTGPWGVSWGVGRIQGLRAGRGHRRGRGLGWRRRWGSHRGDGDAGGGLRAVGMPSGSREDEDTSFSWRALQEDGFGGQTFVDSRPAGP